MAVKTMGAAATKPSATGGTGPAAARTTARELPKPRTFRLIDLITLGYFGMNTLLLMHPNRPANWPALLAVHLLYLVGVPLLVRFGERNPVFKFLREWYPLLGIVFMYNELQYLNRVLTDLYFDPFFIRWEERIFGSQLATTFRQAMPWKALGEALHFGYFCYYFTLPTLFFPLWFLGKRHEFRVSVGVVAAVYYFCYLWYIFLPVTGPYWQFQPFPDPAAQGWFFPKLTNAVVAGGSSRGSAFPSSHIAASVTVLGMAYRYLKPVFRILLIPVTLLCIGTVYGGFHYAIDSIAGLTIALLAVRFLPGIVIKHDYGKS